MGANPLAGLSDDLSETAGWARRGLARHISVSGDARRLSVRFWTRGEIRGTELEGCLVYFVVTGVVGLVVGSLGKWDVVVETAAWGARLMVMTLALGEG